MSRILKNFFRYRWAGCLSLKVLDVRHFRMTLVYAIRSLMSWVVVDVRIQVENQITPLYFLILITNGSFKKKLF